MGESAVGTSPRPAVSTASISALEAPRPIAPAEPIRAVDVARPVERVTERPIERTEDPAWARQELNEFLDSDQGRSFNFSVRLAAQLEKANIRTLGQLLRLSEIELLSIQAAKTRGGSDGIGRKTLKELKDRLAENNLALAMTDAEIAAIPDLGRPREVIQGSDGKRTVRVLQARQEERTEQPAAAAVMLAEEIPVTLLSDRISQGNIFTLNGLLLDLMAAQPEWAGVREAARELISTNVARDHAGDQRAKSEALVNFLQNAARFAGPADVLELITRIQRGDPVLNVRKYAGVLMAAAEKKRATHQRVSVEALAAETVRTEPEAAALQAPPTPDTTTRDVRVEQDGSAENGQRNEGRQDNQGDHERDESDGEPHPAETAEEGGTPEQILSERISVLRGIMDRLCHDNKQKLGDHSAAAHKSNQSRALKSIESANIPEAQKFFLLERFEQNLGTEGGLERVRLLREKIESRPETVKALDALSRRKTWVLAYRITNKVYHKILLLEPKAYEAAMTRFHASVSNLKSPSSSTGLGKMDLFHAMRRLDRELDTMRPQEVRESAQTVREASLAADIEAPAAPAEVLPATDLADTAPVAANVAAAEVDAPEASEATTKISTRAANRQIIANLPESLRAQAEEILNLIDRTYEIENVRKNPALIVEAGKALPDSEGKLRFAIGRRKGRVDLNVKNSLEACEGLPELAARIILEKQREVIEGTLEISDFTRKIRDRILHSEALNAQVKSFEERATENTAEWGLASTRLGQVYRRLILESEKAHFDRSRERLVRRLEALQSGSVSEIAQALQELCDAENIDHVLRGKAADSSAKVVIRDVTAKSAETNLANPITKTDLQEQIQTIHRRGGEWHNIATAMTSLLERCNPDIYDLLTRVFSLECESPNHHLTLINILIGNSTLLTRDHITEWTSETLEGVAEARRLSSLIIDTVRKFRISKTPSRIACLNEAGVPQIPEADPIPLISESPFIVDSERAAEMFRAYDAVLQEIWSNISKRGEAWKAVAIAASRAHGEITKHSDIVQPAVRERLAALETVLRFPDFFETPELTIAMIEYICEAPNRKAVQDRLDNIASHKSQKETAPAIQSLTEAHRSLCERLLRPYNLTLPRELENILNAGESWTAVFAISIRIVERITSGEGIALPPNAAASRLFLSLRKRTKGTPEAIQVELEKLEKDLTPPSDPEGSGGGSDTPPSPPPGDTPPSPPPAETLVEREETQSERDVPPIAVEELTPTAEVVTPEAPEATATPLVEVLDEIPPAAPKVVVDATPLVEVLDKTPAAAPVHPIVEIVEEAPAAPEVVADATPLVEVLDETPAVAPVHPIVEIVEEAPAVPEVVADATPLVEVLDEAPAATPTKASPEVVSEVVVAQQSSPEEIYILSNMSFNTQGRAAYDRFSDKARAGLAKILLDCRDPNRRRIIEALFTNVNAQDLREGNFLCRLFECLADCYQSKKVNRIYEAFIPKGNIDRALRDPLFQKRILKSILTEYEIVVRYISRADIKYINLSERYPIAWSALTPVQRDYIQNRIDNSQNFTGVESEAIPDFRVTKQDGSSYLVEVKEVYGSDFSPGEEPLIRILKQAFRYAIVRNTRTDQKIGHAEFVIRADTIEGDFIVIFRETCETAQIPFILCKYTAEGKLEVVDASPGLNLNHFENGRTFAEARRAQTQPATARASEPPPGARVSTPPEAIREETDADLEASEDSKIQITPAMARFFNSLIDRNFYPEGNPSLNAKNDFLSNFKVFRKASRSQSIESIDRELGNFMKSDEFRDLPGVVRERILSLKDEINRTSKTGTHNVSQRFFKQLLEIASLVTDPSSFLSDPANARIAARKKALEVILLNPSSVSDELERMQQDLKAFQDYQEHLTLNDLEECSPDRPFGLNVIGEGITLRELYQEIENNGALKGVIGVSVCNSILEYINQYDRLHTQLSSRAQRPNATQNNAEA